MSLGSCLLVFIRFMFISVHFAQSKLFVDIMLLLFCFCFHLYTIHVISVIVITTLNLHCKRSVVLNDNTIEFFQTNKTKTKKKKQKKKLDVIKCELQQRQIHKTTCLRDV